MAGEKPEADPASTMIRRFALLLGLVAGACGPALAEDAKPAPPAAPAPAAAPASAATTAAAPAPPDEAQRFCQTVATAAADARFALQTRKLNTLDAEMAKKIAALEAKEAEVKELLERRDAVKKQVEGTLVGIFAKMRPDAAAQELAGLDDGTAAALLESLNARQSSAILNEIPTERAVKLITAIQALAPPTPPGGDGKS